MKNLTPRQQEILTFIQKHIQDTGFPPTRAEICRALGFRSPNSAEEHLRALARKGAISMAEGTSRGIRLSEGSFSPQAMASLLSLPLVGRVAAGSPILAQEHIEQHYQVDPQLFSEPPDYLLQVRGLSMKDAGILHGDLLAVRRLAGGLSDCRNGQIIVARLEDEVTVKRFERSGNEVLLHPENPDFSVIRVDPSHDALRIEGRAVGVIRPFA